MREELSAVVRVTRRDHTIGLSAITVAELEHGARLSGDYDTEIEAVRMILTPFIVFSFDAIHSSYHYGKIRHELESAGKSIGSMDLLIAAQALALGATLVTNNLRHFSRVADLKCVTWTN